MKSSSLAIVLICFLPLLAAAQNPFIQEMVNSVSTDSLTATMLRLQGFGTRYELSPQQDSAGEFLLQEHLRRGVPAAPQEYAFGTTGMSDIQFASSTVGWVCDAGGAVTKTTDGGNSWTSQRTTVSSRLICLDFINEQVGWAAGAAGIVIHSTDGGEHWAQQPSGISVDINDIAFLNQNTGLAVGTGGRVLKTANGGVTWDSIGVVSSSTLMSVAYADSLHAWAAGYEGTILASTNGGQTWTQQFSGVTTRLYAIDFVTPQIGYAAGSSKTLLKTTNGGASWSQLDFPASGTIARVRFTDATHGWALSSSYKVLETFDGGTTWDTSFSILSTGWGPHATALDVTDAGHLAVCGTRSSIYTSSDNGATWQERSGALPSWYFHPTANIVATLTGIVDPLREVILVAHYDSYSSFAPYDSAPGANDNASGTSAVMEAARICSRYQFESTLIFMTVSGEELGMMGSYYAATQARAQGRNIAAVVNGDMLGYPTTADATRLVIASYLQFNRLIDSALAVNQRYGIGLTLQAAADNTGASDYGPFAQAGFDALEVAEDLPDPIWGGADPYYHTPMDVVSNIQPDLVRRGAQLMLAVAAELAHPVQPLSADYFDEQPANLALFQNYPNPFNPSTVIGYTVGDLGRGREGDGGRGSVLVQLAVYDLLGREVAVLVSERQAPGRYEVTFDGAGLASGVYVYQIRNGGKVLTRKMLLLR